LFLSVSLADTARLRLPPSSSTSVISSTRTSEPTPLPTFPPTSLPPLLSRLSYTTSALGGGGAACAEMGQSVKNAIGQTRMLEPPWPPSSCSIGPPG
jgi:hypothetical protein